jgi:hypothetical protein
MSIGHQSALCQILLHELAVLTSVSLASLALSIRTERTLWTRRIFQALGVCKTTHSERRGERT